MLIFVDASEVGNLIPNFINSESINYKFWN